jgi:hypothetical protein
MVGPTASGCINHPGVEAVARCKQCGKPVCGACVVTGPTGRFCSEACKEKHEKFVSRAQALQRTSRSAGTLTKLRRLLIKLVILLAAIVALGFVVVYFEIPVAADIVRKVLRILSPYLPFLR